MQRSHVSSILLLLLLLNLYSTPSASSGIYRAIQNLNDTHVIDIAKFAVNEYNSQTHSSLRFEEVVEGEKQLVSGVNYKLVINASSIPAFALYQAVVYEQSEWNNYTSLTSFVKV